MALFYRYASLGLVRYRDSVVLICALLVVHAPLMVNNGLFGDDWLLLKVKPEYPVHTAFLLHGAGHPLLYAYCTLANWLGDPVLFMKLLALAGIAIGSLSLKSFLLRLGIFSRFETSVFTFLVWSYAGYQNWASKLTATYIFSFALLCLGLNLFSIVASSRRPHTWQRLSALAAIFCSFSLNSMIAAYFVGLCAVVLVERLKQGGKRIPVPTLIRLFADFLLVPFVYWFSMNHFFPKIGPYHDYYMIRIPRIGDLLSGLYNFLNWGFYHPGLEAIALMRESRLLIAAVLLVGFGFVALINWQNSKREDGAPASARTVVWLAATAVIVFVACASPYIVSGISPSGHFFESRHLILFGLPCGLILIGAYRALCLISRSRTAGWILVAISLSLNLSALWSGYFFQQARWLRQEALIEGLQRSYHEPPAAVFNLSDGFLDYPGNTYLGTTEITGALHTAWDGRPLFGFTGRNERPTILEETDKSMHMDGTALRNIDLWGPQATIQLTPKAPVLTNYRLSRRYYRCLITLCDERSVIDTLADITIQVGPISNLAPHQS
jgi:hypothetical protein